MVIFLINVVDMLSNLSKVMYNRIAFSHNSRLNIFFNVLQKMPLAAVLHNCHIILYI